MMLFGGENEGDDTAPSVSKMKSHPEAVPWVVVSPELGHIAIESTASIVTRKLLARAFLQTITYQAKCIL
jgi:hypothetical protein